MKSTYTAPVATICGDVVRATLSGKPTVDAEDGDFIGPLGGNSLSFGL